MAATPKGLRTNSTKNIKLDWNTEEFEQNVNRIIEEIPDEIGDILKDSAPVFVKAAARYTPPSIGKNIIEKKHYERPYLVLSRLVNGGYSKYKATKQDIEQLRAGMIYKILDTRKGKPKGAAYAYCKRKGDLKKLIKIKTRGLARVMWGKDLPNIGQSIPNTLLNLIKKADKLSNLNFNQIDVVNNDDESTLNITNNAKNVENYGRMAESQGYKKSLNFIMKKLKEIAERDIEV